jgi:hypothetical protein
MEGLALVFEAMVHLIKFLLWVVGILLFIGYVTLAVFFPIPVLAVTVVVLAGYGSYYLYQSFRK